ncbi:MAG: hypothetical protein LBL39_08575, partial [Planctomycetaceae bacterium]|nr:hypothetical protein [Planctomycetaceae bacterium]
MRRIRNVVIIVTAIVCCVLTNKQIWAQNNFNGYVVNSQNNTYNQMPQNHIVQAVQNSKHDNGSPIAPTVYQAANYQTATNNTPTNNIPANNTQPTHLSTLYLPAKPNQAAPVPVVTPNSIPAPPPIPVPTIRTHEQNVAGQITSGQTVPQNNALPYSPFPVAKPIPFPTPTPFPAPSAFPTSQNVGSQNVGLNQDQNSGLNNPNNNVRNDSVITTVGFVAPDVATNNSPTDPNPQISNAPQPLNERNSQTGAATVGFPAANGSGGYNPNNTVNTVRNVAVANNPVVKSHKLQHLTGVDFETKLVKKLGQRFVAVRNVGNSNETSRYKLPVKDGSSVDLAIERVNGIVTLTGSNATVDNCVKIVRLLDLPDSRDGSVTEFVSLENANSGALRQAANLINQFGQNQSAQSTVRLVQNQPNTTPEARANPNTPPTVNNDQIKKEEVPPSPAANDPANGGNGTILGPVQVSVIDGADVFVVTGQPHDVAIVENIIAQIDKISLEYEPAIELVPLKQADSYRVSSIVQQLYSQIYAQRRGSITMMPLIKPNTILMVGKKENIDTAKELVRKLDLPVDPKSQFKLFRLRHAQAETLQTEINNFYQIRISTGGLEQQVSVIADPRTNSLIVLANPRDFTEVEEMIKQLDVEGSETKSIVKTFFLKNAVASELAQTLQTAISGTASTGNYGYSSNTNQQSRYPLVAIQDDKNNGLTKPVSTLYDIRIAADVRSNSIIVTAPLDTMKLIEILIRQLDQHPSAESVIKIFTLVNADAYTVTTMLQSL